MADHGLALPGYGVLTCLRPARPFRCSRRRKRAGGPCAKGLGPERIGAFAPRGARKQGAGLRAEGFVASQRYQQARRAFQARGPAGDIPAVKDYAGPRFAGSKIIVLPPRFTTANQFAVGRP